MTTITCQGTTKTGSRCRRLVKNGTLCIHHQHKSHNWIQEKPDECPVCFEGLGRSKPLSCGHWVHRNCILQSGKKECPICRAKLKIRGSVKKLKPDTPDTPDFVDLLQMEDILGDDMIGFVTIIGENIILVIHT
jgi:hypothetical protein